MSEETCPNETLNVPAPKGTPLTLSEVADVEDAYRNLPVKTEVIVDVALSMVALAGYVKALKEGSDKVLKDNDRVGVMTMSSTDPKFKDVMEGLEAVKSRVVYVENLFVIKKEHLRMEDLKDKQNALAKLILHGLCVLK